MISKLQLFGLIGAIGMMLMAVGANASTELNIKDHGKVTAVISNREQNRIHVKDDRVENVFGSEDMFVYHADAKLGQIFLRPRHKSQGFTVTITTEKNKTIDMYLVPDNRDSETIILSVEENKSKNEKGKKQDNFGHLIDAAIKGEPIKGYTEKPINDSSLDLDYKELVSQKEYKSKDWLIGVSTFKNLKDHTVHLNEGTFFVDEKVVAVGIAKKKLEKDESTKVVFVWKQDQKNQS